MKAIIYPVDSGIAVIIPANQNVASIALKDVPRNVPFKIVDAESLPSRDKRSEWVADFTDPDGHGGDFGEGSEWAVVGYDRDGRPETLIKLVKEGKRQRLGRTQKRELSEKEASNFVAIKEKGKANLRIKESL